MGQITLKEVRIEHETKRGGENKRTHHKMYIFIENETLLENLNNRSLRPFKMYREEVVPMVMEHLKRYEPSTYKLVKDSKWGWSKHCGCSMCPCSPGFISDISNHENHRTLFVTIK